jgi:type IX secretion system PorP/SprF family membrane protein
MIRKLLFFVCCWIIPLVALSQQDDQLSQYAFNPLAVNPAYAGSRGTINATLSARSQWMGFQGSPQTGALAISAPFRDNKMAIGFRLRDEQTLFDQKLEASVCYAYRLKLFNGKLAFGISAGITNVTYNWFNVDFRDNADVFAQSQRSTVLLPRFDAGLFFNNEKSFFSLSATHLYDQVILSHSGTPYSGNLQPHAYMAYSRALQINDLNTLNPAFLCKWTKGTNPLADLNLYLGFKNILWIGAGYRSNNSFLLLAQLIINKQFRIGYSYDATNSGPLYPYSTHEILLSLDLKVFKSNALSFRYF